MEELANTLNSLVEQIPTPKKLADKGMANWKGLDIENIIQSRRDSRSGNLKGLYTLIFHPEYFIKVVEPVDEFGLCKIRWWPGEGKTKVSTIFRNDWDVIQLAENLLEALSNIFNVEIKNEGFSMIGRTSDGLEIRFYSDFTGFIKAAFPLTFMEFTQ